MKRGINKKNLAVVGLFVLLLACVGWQATIVQQSNPSFQIDGSATTPSYSFGTTPGLGIYKYNANNLGVVGNSGHPDVAIGTNGIYVTSNGVYHFSSGTTDPGASIDASISRDAPGVVDIGTGANGSKAGTIQFTTMVIQATLFASLGTPGNGTMLYCSDCTIANPCASGGTGAYAKRLNGAWVCN